MKFTRENLLKMKYIKNGAFSTGKNFYFIKICMCCKEVFLGQRTAKFCNLSCRSTKEFNSNYNKKMSDEQKIKISKSKIGSKLSEENKRKIGLAISGKKHYLYGKYRSEETKAKISKNRKGIKHTEETKKKISEKHKGKVLTPKHRINISKALKGKYIGEKIYRFGKTNSEETKKKISEANKGKPVSDEQRKRISNTLKGRYTKEKHPNWLGGISYEEYCSVFYDNEYKQSIRDRDHNMCWTCGKTKEHNNTRNLNVHHIDYDKQNCAPINLITLCDSCHSISNFSRKWWEEWYQLIIKKRFGYKYNKRNGSVCL